MTAGHTEFRSMLQRWVQRRRHRRRRIIAARVLSELPAALQRDIGWSNPRDDRD
ncbi:hypothetical protein [Nitratireductor pacificus]|uniref:hypothetical protein n=1 Tax=Nitratireductor pacificus TaxID=1231180 RepID=UPI000307BAD1|nr:hypothetical protein [Nitratireductor pacificus]